MKRQAFTLVELVVVVLILGILAGVAAPRFLDTSGEATDASIQQTLSVVRDAIELYTATEGRLPPHNGSAAGAGSLADSLDNYLRNGIPNCPVGNVQNNTVGAVTGEGAEGATPAVTGWVYNTEDGTFVCGFAGASNTAGVNYDDY